MKNIEIDFEVYKALTARLESEDDSENNVIRRLLKLGTAVDEAAKSNGTHNGPVWVTKGYVFPEGTQFQAQYNGELYNAEVKNGKFVYAGKTYNSFSGAAKDITGTQRNGWDFWQQKQPGGTRWRRLYKRVTV